MARRYRSGTITIDISDHIDSIDDDILLDEVKSRKLSINEPGETVDLDIVREAYDALQRHAVAEAVSILDRLLFPKWRDRKACQADYEKRAA